MPLKEDLDGGSFKDIRPRDGKGKVNRFSEGLIFQLLYEKSIALKTAHSVNIIGNFKLIKFYDNKELMLFNLKNDIGENINLASSPLKKTSKLAFLLESYLGKVKAPKWQPGINWKNKPIEKFNSYH